MSTLIRTANCRKCGSTEFNLKPKVGEVDYICVKCNENVATVKYDDYETVNKKCECSSDTFKAKVTGYSDTEEWETYCSKCSEKPKKCYIDKDGNEIDRVTRELLIIRSSMNDLKSRVETLESDLNSLDSTVQNIGNETSSNETDLYDIKNNINKYEQNISDLERKLIRLE